MNKAKLGLIGKLLVAGACLLPGCATTQTKTPKLTGSASTTFVTEQVSPSGGLYGTGPSQQAQVSVNYGNLSAFTWGLYDHTDKQAHELDFGVGYSIPITENLTAGLGYQSWNYPSKVLPNSDNMFQTSLSYTGPIDLNLTYRHVLKNNGFRAGNIAFAEVSKTFPVSEKVSLTPNIGASYLEYWYGSEGFSRVAAGLDVTIKTGENTFLKGFGKNQWGFINGIEN